MPSDTNTIPISRWGKDHWSMFAYVETLAVDYDGIAQPNRDRMRTDKDRHPHLLGPTIRMLGESRKYPTLLAGGAEQTDHDDWDCLDDAVAEGLLEDIGSGLNRAYKLTKIGQAVAAKLRRHKQNGGTFGNFCS